MFWLKIGGAAAVAFALWWALNTVLGWKADAARLPQVQAQFSTYRTDIETQAQERARREAVHVKTETDYQARLREQGEALASARGELRHVRLRLGACPRPVPAADGAAAAAAEPDAGSADGLPDNLAEMAGDRFARCDAIAAQLNALIEWERRIRREGGGP